MSTDPNTDSTNTTSSGNEPLFQYLIDRLAGRNKDELSESTAGDENARVTCVEEVLANQARLDQVLGVMYPETPHPAGFFERLDVLREFVGFSERAHRVVGGVWSAALHKFGLAEREAILADLFNARELYLFELLDGLEFVITEHELRPAFAADFFASGADRVGKDIAGGGLWKAVIAFCERHISSALQTVRQLFDTPSETRIGVASFMLGSLRNLSLTEIEREAFNQVSSAFANHAAVQMRSVFNRSWTTTAFQKGIEESEMREILDRYEQVAVEEQHDIIGVVCGIVIAGKVSDVVAEIGLGWLRKHVDSSISSLAKLHVVNLVATLANPSRPPDGRQLDDASNLIRVVQPIPDADLGAWHHIERHLVNLLDSDVDKFSEVFFQLAEGDPAGFHSLMCKQRQFTRLRHKLSGKDVSKVVARLVVSDRAGCRRLGLYLFDELGIEKLPDEVLEARGDVGVRLAFHELQRNLLDGAAVARLLLSLLPRAQLMGSDFQAEFFHELLLQARDRPGSCRGELEKRGASLPMVAKVLEELVKHFQALDRAHESGIAAMDVPGFRRAAGLYRRRFSKQVEDGAKEHSTLWKLCKQVALLYGGASGAYADGQLIGPSPLAELSHSMELPSVSFGDPEGMMLRRLYASMRLAELTRTQTPDNPEEDE